MAYEVLNSKKIAPRARIPSIILFVLAQVLAAPYVIEPFRTFIAVSLVTIVFYVMKQYINLVFTLLVSSIFAVLKITSILATSTLLIETNMESPLLFGIIALVLEAFLYFSAYRICKSTAGFFAYATKEVKGVLYSLCAICLALFGVISMHLPTEGGTNYSFAEIINVILVLASLVILTANLLLYMRNQQRQRIVMQKKSDELSIALQDIVKRHHKYRDSVPTLLAAFQGLVNEIGPILGANEQQQLQRLDNYVALINHLTEAIGGEFSNDDIESEIKDLDLPDDYLDLGIRLGQFIALTREKGIAMFLQNRVRDWDKLPISSIELIQIIGNLLDNAIRELLKTDINNRKVMLKLFETNGKFSLSIRDNAHEFSIEVLKGLGKERVTTSGSGYGYAEICEILAAVNASLSIKEQGQGENDHIKVITIAFDELGEYVIDSKYRKEQLQAALIDTKFQVR